MASDCNENTTKMVWEFVGLNVLWSWINRRMIDLWGTQLVDVTVSGDRKKIRPTPNKKLAANNYSPRLAALPAYCAIDIIDEVCTLTCKVHLIHKMIGRRPRSVSGLMGS